MFCQWMRTMVISLRAKGLPLGKRDFLGRMRMKD